MPLGELYLKHKEIGKFKYTDLESMMNALMIPNKRQYRYKFRVTHKKYLKNSRLNFRNGKSIWVHPFNAISILAVSRSISKSYVQQMILTLL